MKEKKTVIEIVNEKIIEKLEQGVNPWRKPWNYPTAVADARYVATNYFSNTAYNGINRALLDPGYYVTFKQCQNLGGKIKKGANGHIVVYSSQYFVDEKKKNAEGEEKIVSTKHFILKYYYVFKLEDTEGCRTINRDNIIADTALKTAEEVDLIIKDYCNRTQLKYKLVPQDEAYYSPSFDEVVLPLVNQFHSLNAYYAVAFHELGHSTGHSKRLNRGLDDVVGFSSESYSKEELIAEITSAYCSNYVGTVDDQITENNIAYLKGWASKLKGNTANWFILNATTHAEKAFKLIMNINAND